MLTSAKETSVVQSQATKDTSVVQNISQKCKMITLILVIQGANVLGAGNTLEDQQAGQARLRESSKSFADAITNGGLDKIVEQNRIPNLAQTFRAILNAILKATKKESIESNLNALAGKIDKMELLSSGVEGIKPEEVFNQKIVKYIESLFNNGSTDVQQNLLSNLLLYLNKLSSDKIDKHKELIKYLGLLKVPTLTNEEKKTLNEIKGKLQQALKAKSTLGKLNATN